VAGLLVRYAFCRRHQENSSSASCASSERTGAKGESWHDSFAKCAFCRSNSENGVTCVTCVTRRYESDGVRCFGFLRGRDAFIRQDLRDFRSLVLNRVHLVNPVHSFTSFVLGVHSVGVIRKSRHRVMVLYSCDSSTFVPFVFQGFRLRLCRFCGSFAFFRVHGI
jgi:hypothetical protein